LVFRSTAFPERFPTPRSAIAQILKKESSIFKKMLGARVD